MAVELELDEEGWASVDDVLAALRTEREAWCDLTENDLAEMIASSDKQRHEMRDGKIRALYGHSIPGKLQKTPSAPPTHLFHGTSPAALPAIEATGLLPMSRQYVHLSIDTDTAMSVGKRKSKHPIILRIHAEQAHRSGVPFYLGNDKVWLADRVPPEFIGKA